MVLVFTINFHYTVLVRPYMVKIDGEYHLNPPSVSATAYINGLSPDLNFNSSDGTQGCSRKACRAKVVITYWWERSPFPRSYTGVYRITIDSIAKHSHFYYHYYYCMYNCIKYDRTLQTH